MLRENLSQKKQPVNAERRIFTMTENNGLGRAIEMRRIEMGLKRKDLHERAHLSYPYISEIENGVKEPSAKALRLIAQALDMKVANLADLAEKMQASEAGSNSILFDSSPTVAYQDVSVAEQQANTVGLSAPKHLMKPSPVPPRSGEPAHELPIEDQVARALQSEVTRWASQELPGIVQREVNLQLAERLKHFETPT